MLLTLFFQTMYGSMKKANGAAGNPLLEGDERHYFKRMKEILEDFPNKGPPSVPSQLLPHLYIGSLRNAEDHNMLQRLNISHVLNVAGTRKFDLTKSPYPKDIGVREYLMIPAEDHDAYNIVQHFFEANAFINRAKRVGGKALVHCNLGVNRCGALCAAYLLIEERLPLLEVVRFLKKKRGVVLCNKGFRRQILRYAMARGLIEVVNNGNKYGSLGTISKYLVNQPAGRPELERQKERMRESEIARRKEQERLSFKGTSKTAACNGHAVVNGTNGTMNGNGNGNGNGNRNGHRNGEKSEKASDEGEKENGSKEEKEPATAQNGDVSEEDEEVANLVSQPVKISRFLPRNSTVYSPEPGNDEEPRSFSSGRRYQRSYTGEIGTSSARPYSPTFEFGTTFGRTKPYQRSYSADIESQSNRCTSPDNGDVEDEAESSSRTRPRGRKPYADERPVTVCGDYTTSRPSRFMYNNRYGPKKVYRQDDSDDDLDSEYTPLINVFHLEHLDGGNSSRSKSSDMYQPMCFGSEPNLIEKNAKLSSYVHVRPYEPSLEFIGRKTVTSGSSYSSGRYSTKRYGSSQSRPHSMYTDRPYSSSGSESLYFSSHPLSYRSTSYKGYSPEILPSSSDTNYSRPYSSYNSSTSYRRGPISSALLRHSRNLSSSISDYTRSYNSLY